MSVISLFSWCYRSRVIAIFETRGLQLRPVPVATFLPFNPQAVTKKIPCRSVAATMLHVAAMFDSEWKKKGTIWRFEIPRSSKSGEEIMLDRSLPFRSPISDPPGVRRGQFQCSFATGPRGPLGLSVSYRKTHQDTSRWLLRLLLRLVEVANGTVLQKLKAIVWLVACFESFWIPSEKILDFLS